jgi:hypothetical protein
VPAGWFAFRQKASRLRCGVDDGYALRDLQRGAKEYFSESEAGLLPKERKAIRQIRKLDSIRFKEGARAPRPWEGNAPCAHC